MPVVGLGKPDKKPILGPNARPSSKKGHVCKWDVQSGDM